MRILKHFAAGALAAGLAFSGAAQAAVIDLGFALDESGSVGSSNFAQAREALANALGLIPTSGPNTYRVSVYTFDSGVTEVVAPTAVNAGNLAAIRSAVATAAYSGGGTNIAAAVTALTSAFTGLGGGLGDTTLFNVTTDGQSSITALQAAATAAAAAGVDGLSFEGVGTGVDVTGLASVAFPTPAQIVNAGGTIPNPTQAGFVLAVAGFAEYEAAIRAKIQRTVIDTGGGPGEVPVPAALPLLLTALGAVGVFGARRRAA